MVEIVAIEYGDRLLEQGVRKYPTSLKLVENACATRDLWALTETRSQSTAFPRYKIIEPQKIELVCCIMLLLPPCFRCDHGPSLTFCLEAFAGLWLVNLVVE
jgi:hypothetical protein